MSNMSMSRDQKHNLHEKIKCLSTGRIFVAWDWRGCKAAAYVATELMRSRANSKFVEEVFNHELRMFEAYLAITFVSDMEYEYQGF
jgi:hypothetical protein